MVVKKRNSLALADVPSIVDSMENNFGADPTSSYRFHLTLPGATARIIEEIGQETGFDFNQVVRTLVFMGLADLGYIQAKPKRSPVDQG